MPGDTVNRNALLEFSDTFIYIKKNICYNPDKTISILKSLTPGSIFGMLKTGIKSKNTQQENIAQIEFGNEQIEMFHAKIREVPNGKDSGDRNTGLWENHPKQLLLCG